MISDLKPLIGKLCLFCKEKMGFERPPRLFLKNDSKNAELALGKTAHYDPNQESITLFVNKRHPKDILRSLAHELVHHTQNLRGDLSPEKLVNMGKNYAQNNDHMRNMEKEAYLQGNMCFRDWEDGLDNKELFTIKLAESKFLKENKTMTTKITKKFLRETIRKILAEELGSVDEDVMTIDDMAKGVQANIGKKRGAKAAVAQGIRMGGPVGLKAALKAAIASGDMKLIAAAAEASGREPSLRDSELRMVALKAVRDKGGTSRQNIDSHSAGREGGMMQGLKNFFKEGEELEEAGCGSHKVDDEEIEEGMGAACCYKEGCPGPGKPHEGEFAIEEGEKPDFPDVDGDGDRKEPISKAQKEKKEKKGDDAEKQEESKIQTPEQENALYENRFSGKNERLYQKLLKEWAK